MSVSKKIQNNINAINEALETSYVARLVQVPYEPEYLQFFNKTKDKTFSFGKFVLFNHCTYVHKAGKRKIYGITWSKFYIGIRCGLKWHHIRFPKFHKVRCSKTRYEIKGMNAYNLTAKEARNFLSEYMSKNGVISPNKIIAECFEKM
ncbi:MAG TPA: hypothetical protein DCE52_04295 [Rhodobacteraceae bacterium]|nr:hypothetical protein [Paracoccaceae bacterium]